MPVDKAPVLVLGATSGIARAVAREVARRGHPVLLAGRDEEELARDAADIHIRSGVSVWHSRYDASETESNKAFLARVAEEVGPIAGAVLAIGYLGDQKAAQQDWTETRRILEANFVHAASALHALADHFEAAHDGWIVVLSSVAGDRGRMSNYVYGSAKGGLAVFCQGLRARLQKSGVHLMTVKPGPVDTAMTYGMDRLPLLAQPDAVGKAIVRALLKRRDEVYVPGPWRLVMFLLKAVPERLFKKTSL